MQKLGLLTPKYDEFCNSYWIFLCYMLIKNYLKHRRLCINPWLWLRIAGDLVPAWCLLPILGNIYKINCYLLLRKDPE